MDWDAIGAIGEIVGATAVVLSLFYVGLQVRQSATAVRGQTYESLSASAIDVTMQMTADMDLSLAMRSAMLGEEVHSDQDFRVGVTIHCYTRIAATAHYQHELGLLDGEQLKNLTATNVVHLSSPIGKRYWNSNKQLFSRSFVSYIEQEMSGPSLYASEAVGGLRQ